MNGAVEMECDRECRLLLNDLNDILSEQCLEQRVRCRYLNNPVQELAGCINQLSIPIKMSTFFGNSEHPFPEK